MGVLIFRNELRSLGSQLIPGSKNQQFLFFVKVIFILDPPLRPSSSSPQVIKHINLQIELLSIELMQWYISLLT